jgi:predicted ArsR family transcriptional regulator
VEAGREMTTVAEDIEMTRSGVQRHLEVLMEHELVIRSETGDTLYRVTPLGRFFVRFTEGFAPALSEVLAQVEQVEQEARDEYADLPVNEQTLERMVGERKWEEQKELLQVLEKWRPQETDVEQE